MTITSDLCYLTLDEIAERISTRDVSPVEVTRATLERIERLNPKLNAYITVLAEQALAEARTAQEQIAVGTYLGPLHGVPVGLKDLCETRGVRTAAGSKILSDSVPVADAPVVQKLRDAGAVIVGKLNMHEWAFGTTGVNPHFGACRNPWDTERITGGSSSGSASAVAAGLCYAAIGSDTGGSIRIPASLCGTVGIKATYGRVSLRGVVPLATSLDHVGPLARSALDCAIVLSAIAGRDIEDETSSDEPALDWAAGLRQAQPDLAGLHIGVGTYGLGDTQPAVKTAFEQAVATLLRLGAKTKEVDTSTFSTYFYVGGVVLLSEAAAYHKDNIEKRPQDYGEDVRMRLQSGLDQKAVDYVRAMAYMRELRRTCDDVLLDGLDLLVMPTTIMTAPRIDTVTTEDPTLGLSRLTLPFDVTGQPSMSVPCGFDDAGMPVGLMLAGRRFDEATVFRAASAFERESGLSGRRPPIEYS
jgi:aspartyl-tRNA(Asn)/glutamyl-tRNA(Gln) amidotransferase subunit A